MINRHMAQVVNGAKSHLRGHPIYWDGVQWRYSDTNELTIETWGSRSCGQCGLYGNSNSGNPDPCIGLLPYVTNACCGHGNRGESYICIKDGISVRGFIASILIDIIKTLKWVSVRPYPKKWRRIDEDL